jgi:hypothetical protein
MEERAAIYERALRKAPRSSLRWTAAVLGCLVAACGSPATSTTDGGATPASNTTGLPGAGAAGGGIGLPTGAAGSGAKPPVGTTTTGTGVTPVTPPTGTSTVPTPGAGEGAGAQVLPCGVHNALATNCTTCHAASPIGGAPMPLVTYADLQKPAVTQPSMKVYQLVSKRIHDMMRPMPPTGTLPAADMTALDTWINGGALPGTAADASCASATPTMMPTVGGETTDRSDGSKGALVPLPGETCYEFKTHDSTTSVDDTPYDVGPDGEHYEQFYFKIPWGNDVVATAYATRIDNAAVLHHWLLFSTNEQEQEGFHKTAPLPTLIGTDPILLAGWAVGGPNLVAPEDVGFELPNPGNGTINVQWHFYNSTGSDQKDKSAVQICTVPKAMRAHIGGVTWLGTEDLGGNKWFGGAGMPPHMKSDFTTTCNPARAGVGANDPITIIGFEPHMHRIGMNMKTSVMHTNGMVEEIFNKPFSFGNETHYYVKPAYQLMPGEQLITTCSFNNDTDMGVPFGESSDTEMCYQFTFAWPAHALSNGAASLLGVPDTCW